MLIVYTSFPNSYLALTHEQCFTDGSPSESKYCDIYIYNNLHLHLYLYILIELNCLSLHINPICKVFIL